MPLKAVLDSIDSLPDNIKALYRTGTEGLAGKFILDTEPVGGWALEDVAGLRNAFTTQRDELKAATSALDAFKGLGAASTIREKLGRLARLEKIDPESEADRLAAARARARIDELDAEHATELDRIKIKSDRMVAEITRLILENEVAGAISRHDGSSELLAPHVASRVKIIENEAGEFSVQVMDDQGRPAYRWRGSESIDATIDDLVIDLKSKPAFAGAFKASASGSGATGGRGTAGITDGGPNPFSKNTFNLTEQGRLKKEDPVKYEHLKQLAAREAAPARNLTEQMRAIRAGVAA